MSYLGNNPTYGDTTSNFKLLDDISTYTLTFDGSSSAVVSTSNYTITQTSHRFITGQRVTYTNGGGGSIGGLTSGTAYYIIKNDQNTIKLATSLVNANNNNPISLTSLGTGTSHTLNVAFDSINTKFKATYDNGIKALFTAAAQLQISINGVIQQPQNTTTPVNGFGFDVDAVVIFSTAPAVSDIFWGNIIANNFAAYDISDNVVDNFTGNASQLNFNLSRNVPNSQSLLVTIDGVVQYPSDETTSRAYSVYNNELRFTSAPGSGTVIQARHIGFAGAVTSNVTGFYGRTGNAVLTTSDTVNIGAATIGTGTSTGTTSQPLQVTGGAYVSGNTGIGTTIPQYKLDVLGDINFTGTFYQNSSAFVASRWTAGTGNDIYRLSGNIGIGTTRPTSKLQVVGDVLVSGIVTATSFSGGGANLTSLTAGNLSGTIPSGVLGNSTLYVGTTAVTLNRSSASQSLTGINIDGSSGSCTGNSATATTATNQSGGTVSATTGTFSDTVTLTTVPFFRNTTTIASNYTVTTTYNEMSIGPITINNGITVTVNSGATWTVV